MYRSVYSGTGIKTVYLRKRVSLYVISDFRLMLHLFTIGRTFFILRSQKSSNRKKIIWNLNWMRFSKRFKVIQINFTITELTDHMYTTIMLFTISTLAICIVQINYLRIILLWIFHRFVFWKTEFFHNKRKDSCSGKHEKKYIKKHVHF